MRRNNSIYLALISILALILAAPGYAGTIGTYTFDTGSTDFSDNFTVVHDDAAGDLSDGFYLHAAWGTEHLLVNDTKTHRDGGWAINNAGVLSATDVTVSADVKWLGTNNLEGDSLQRFIGVSLLGGTGNIGDKTYFAGFAATSVTTIIDRFTIGLLEYKYWDPTPEDTTNGDEYRGAYQYTTLATVNLDQRYLATWHGMEFSSALDGNGNVTLTANLDVENNGTSTNDVSLVTTRNLATDGMASTGTVGIVRPGTFNGYGLVDNYAVNYVPEPATLVLLLGGAVTLLRKKK